MASVVTLSAGHQRIKRRIPYMDIKLDNFMRVQSNGTMAPNKEYEKHSQFVKTWNIGESLSIPFFNLF